MSTVTRFLARTTKILTATALAVGLTAGLTAAPASAAAPRAKLTITAIPGDTFQYAVRVVGVYPMQQADAQGYLNNMGPNGGMNYFVRADDPVPEPFHQWITGATGLEANNTPSENALHATPEGLRFARTFVVPRRALNEDDGPIDYRDEIYVRAAFIDGDGGARRMQSNVVSGYF